MTDIKKVFDEHVRMIICDDCSVLVIYYKHNIVLDVFTNTWSILFKNSMLHKETKQYISNADLQKFDQSDFQYPSLPIALLTIKILLSDAKEKFFKSFGDNVVSPDPELGVVPPEK